MTTPKLKAAIAKWRDQPAEARRDVITILRLMATDDHPAILAIRAAVALLKAAQGAK
jgi:hypothetical protein